jgi:ribonuclease BN (tRNA processing enzyme)
VDVWGPTGTEQRLAQIAGSDPATDVGGQFIFHEWDATAPVIVGPLTLTPVPVLHPIPAFGIRVEGPSDVDPARTVTLAYTGDTDACDGLDELARADLLLAEAAFIEGRDDAVRGVHLTGRRAGAAATTGGAGRLVLTHLPAWTPADTATAEARGEYAGPIDVAAPGATYVL